MELFYVKDRVIVAVSMEGKNYHTFSDGTKIRLERRFDNFDRKYTQPVNATVISAENIPAGAEILIHHNATDETNRITNYNNLSGEDIASDVRYFSVPTADCFAWRDDNEWLPLPPFDFGLRIFKPYTGALQGIEPELIVNALFITTGYYNRGVMLTLKASDYTIIFQDTNGAEKRLIRIRTDEDEATKREAEVVALDHVLTEKVLNGEYFVGLTKADCKPLNQYLNDSRPTAKPNKRIIA